MHHPFLHADIISSPSTCSSNNYTGSPLHSGTDTSDGCRYTPDSTLCRSRDPPTWPAATAALTGTAGEDVARYGSVWFQKPEAARERGRAPLKSASNSADCSCAALAWTDQQSSSGIRHRANRVTNVPQNRRTVCTTESLLVYAKYITQSNKRHRILPHLDPYPTVVITTWENNIKILPPVQSPINNGCSWTLLYNLSVRQQRRWKHTRVPNMDGKELQLPGLERTSR